MLIPTRRLWWLAAALVLPALAGAFVPGLERLTWIGNLCLLALFLITGLTARRWNFLRAERRVDQIMSARVPNLVRLTIHNESDRPIAVKVHDEAPMLADVDRTDMSAEIPADGSREFTYHVTPRERGQDAFRGVTVRYPAPLGLCEIQTRLPAEQPIRVYPNVLAIREFELLKQKGRLNLMGVRRSQMRGIGSEFESLRDYNDDDFRRIDWKASGRRGRLVVRNMEPERNQGLIVCIDAGRHMLGEVQGVRKLDYALDSALMLMHAAERMGDQVGLLIYNDLVQRWIPPKRGRAQVAALLDVIHSLQAEPVESNHVRAFAHVASRWKRRSLVVVFTDAEDEAQGTALAAGLAQIRRRHLTMVFRVSDPRLRETLVREVKGAHDLFLRASGGMYDAERQKATSRLAAAGVQNVEAEPQDLTAALISAYLRVKERNLL
ncbi:MAG: DUF58 domain-containing protein [Fimbriimonadaceae bacterium]|nr:DUF58 domain-containing protein [Fimbriimonadaceae bacterium]